MATIVVMALVQVMVMALVQVMDMAPALMVVMLLHLHLLHQLLQLSNKKLVMS